MKFSHFKINGIDMISGENDFLCYAIAPAVGGKITSIFNKELKKEFLWTNENIPLQQHLTGADYDSNFFGGMDELLPNDIPETINGIAYPDHGELWTTVLDYRLENDKVSVFGKLNKSGLTYKKTVRLETNAPMIYLDYTIKNESYSIRNFLWKLHAALSIEPGDRLLTSARKARVVDPGYSRFTNLNEFDWPIIENSNASLVPEKNSSIDFFYLYDNEIAEMNFLGKNDSLFSLHYNQTVFPYQWYFASYGGFLDHYTAILEPCSSMPMSVNDAAHLNQCTTLKPGQQLKTTVKIYAGKIAKKHT
jgi:hypothetical protein